MADKRISQLIERTDIANNDVLPIVANGATTTNKVTVSTLQDWMQDNLDVGVTSVGLSVPSAFSVSGSPVTTSGNITISGAGTTAQYIRGDGSLADFPSISGGGSSVSYYLNGSVSQGTIGGVAYREINKVPILGAGTNITINTNGYIASFITDAGDPALLQIPGGNWNFETVFSANSNAGSPSFYIELYKVNLAGTATLIASNSATPELIAFGTTIHSYFSALAVPTTTLALTDRLAIRYYVTNAGRTITMHTENNTLCQIITTFTTGLTALNGLTAQVQNFATGTSGTDFTISSASTTHTFNLPDASASNRGVVTTGSQTIAGEKNFTSLLTASGANINTPSNGISVLLNGRTSDNFSSIRFGANTGAGQYNSIGANSSSFDISSLGNTPITFSTNTQGGGGTRMTIAGSGGVTFTNGITTTSAVLTSVLQGVNANFSGLIETSDSVRIGTTASVKHSNTGFTLSGFNNIHGNIDGFVVQNQTKGFRINFPSNSSFTHTLPDASGTIALTSNLSAYLPLAGGTLTGALNGTSAQFSGDLQSGTRLIASASSQSILLTPNSGGTTNRVESVGTLPLALVSAAAITMAAGGTTPQITLATGGGVTLTGALNGTSASFTGGVGIGLGLSAGIFNQNTPVAFSTDGTSNSPGLTLFKNSSSSTEHVFRVQSFIGSVVTVASITATGAATFSSSVNVGGALRVSGGSTFTNGELEFTSTTSGGQLGIFSNQGTSTTLFFDHRATGNTGNFSFRNGSGGANTLMYIAGAGNVGIGTASPTNLLHLTGSSATPSLRLGSISAGFHWDIGRENATTGDFVFNQTISGGSPTERMRITSGGDVLVGKSSFTSNSLRIDGNGILSNSRGGTGTNSHCNFFNDNGLVGSITTSGSSTSYNTSSDYRLKENVKPVENALSVLTKLKPCTFNFIADADEEVMGFIAHEVQEVIPQAVIGEKDEVRIEKLELSPAELDEEGNVITEAVIEEKEVPVYQGIDHSKLVPLLVASIQELKTEIDSLKNQIK